MPLRFYRHGRRPESTVALTFDDGPNPPRTEEVLDILAARSVRASFFVMGAYVVSFPKTVQAIVRAGHVVGNHSFRHSRDIADYDEAESVIAKTVGRNSSFLRAPYLHYRSLAQSPPACLSHTKVIDANVRPKDYIHKNSSDVIAAVLEHPRLSGGSIILLHDGSNDSAERFSRPLPMIEALPAIIDGLRERGLTPVGLDEMALGVSYEWRGSHEP